MKEETGQSDKPAKYDKTDVLASIRRDAYEGGIKLEKLGDGYSVSYNDHSKKSTDGLTCEHSSSLSIVRRYGRPVKELVGGFNERGEYEVKLSFERVEDGGKSRE